MTLSRDHQLFRDGCRYGRLGFRLIFVVGLAVTDPSRGYPKTNLDFQFSTKTVSPQLSFGTFTLKRGEHATLCGEKVIVSDMRRVYLAAEHDKRELLVDFLNTIYPETISCSDNLSVISAYSPDFKRLFVYYQSTLTIFGAAAFSGLARIPLGDFGQRVSPDGSSVASVGELKQEYGLPEGRLHLLRTESFPIAWRGSLPVTRSSVAAKAQSNQRVSVCGGLIFFEKMMPDESTAIFIKQQNIASPGASNTVLHASLAQGRNACSFFLIGESSIYLLSYLYQYRNDAFFKIRLDDYKLAPQLTVSGTGCRLLGEKVSEDGGPDVTWVVLDIKSKELNC